MPDTHHDTLPGEHTEPYLPTFDTGEFPSAADPVLPLVADLEPSAPIRVPAQSEVVPGTYQYLKRWTFVLVVAGVSIVGAAIGLGLYYWWFHSLDKTPTVFVVLVFLMVCSVGSVLVAMVNNKPIISALAVALMSAPFAAIGGAAVLYGLYFCDRASRCLVGLIPY
ncbi:hypothetical protein [Mycolicibacterium moriokaense]|uniref:Transmembrane protein n=1 Tax=Mycolicibacterium moriokaense TaxID=39691 RepID=A0A318H7H7_9MYCO|nr:hypothetical protein [Mycolicibacterium moriokaense]PXX00922.1 hypothetical protein C8E89_13164 [Mycolicibacterium moriokaense]